MNRAINTLKARIEKINERITEAERAAEEPEMICDYEFAMNDIANYELELMELQKAIQLLLDTEKEPKQENSFELLDEDLELFKEATKSIMQIAVTTFVHLKIPRFIEGSAVTNDALYKFRIDREPLRQQ